MNLIIDIGNTSAKLVVFEDDEIIAHTSTRNDTLEDLPAFVRQHRPTRGIASTVIPLHAEVRERLALLPLPLTVLSAETPMPITHQYETPQTLGTDRLAAAVGAMTCCPDTDLLVVDLGTCATFDLVTRDGVFIGGNIAPGLRMRLAAMHQYTGRLPYADPDGEKADLLGKNTDTALRMGAINGLTFETEGYIKRLRNEGYDGLKTIVTGGDAQIIAANLSTDCAITYDEWLVARGLNRILRYNEK